MINFNNGDYYRYFKSAQQDINSQPKAKPNVLTSQEANKLQEEILEFHASKNPNKTLQEATSNFLDENLANEVANALNKHEWFA